MAKPKIFHIGMSTGNNGLSRAFAKYSSAYTELNCGDKNVCVKSVEIAKVFRPDIIFMQIQNDNILTENCVKELSLNAKYIVNFTGDVRDDVPQWYYKIGKYVDTTLFADMTDVMRMRAKGFNANYLNLGYDHTIYNPYPKKEKIYDIVFMANNYDNLFPLSNFREKVVESLKKEFGSRFKIFGNGWKQSDGNFNHCQSSEADIYRQSKIGINLSHYCYDRYSSDRMLRILGTGTLCLTHWFPMIELDYTNGKDIVIWDKIDELIASCHYYLANDKERNEIAYNGYENAISTSTFEHMVCNLIEYYKNK